MPKLFTIKWIFYFFLSFIVTFFIGFFAWSAFVDYPGNVVKQGQFFTASVLPPPDESPKEYSQEPATILVAPDLSEDQTATVQNPIVLTDEQKQKILNEIQEKLDLIKQQVNELIAEQNPNPNQTPNINDQVDESDNQDIQDDSQDEQEQSAAQENTCTGSININSASLEDLDKIIEVAPATAQKIIDARPFCSLDDLLRVSGIGPTTLQKIKDQGCAFAVGACATGGGNGGSAGSGAIIYPEILISEVQISPISQRFVEFYNLNSNDVDLTGWYLQRKDANDTSWNSFVSSTHFSGKTIPANGYFLISRELADSNILSGITLSDNNSLALKNPNGEITNQISWSEIADNLSWCVDFETCSPTPKAANTAYVEPPAPTLASIAITTPANKLDYNVGENLDITGLVVTGTYSDQSTQVEAITTDNITGFNSSVPVVGQVLTIAFGGQTTTYEINVIEPPPLPIIVSYTLQIKGQDPVLDNNVVINSTNGVKIKISIDQPYNFKISINGKDYWHTNSPITSITRPSSCSYWPGTANSCDGDILPNGDYPITVNILDTSDKVVLTDESKTITINNSNGSN